MMSRTMTGMMAGLTLLVLTVAGCKTPEVVQSPPPMSREEVMAALKYRAETLKTLRAGVNVKVRLAEMKNTESASGSFAAAGPGSLRLRGKHELLSYAPFDIGSNGSLWWVHVHLGDNERIDYGEVAELMRAYDPGVPIRPDQIVAALGMAAPVDSADRKWVFTKPPGKYVLEEVVSQGRSTYVGTRMELDGRTGLIRKYETLLPTGRVDMSASLEDYKVTGQIAVAGKVVIHLWRTDKPGLLELELKDVRVNQTLPARAFEPPKFEEIPGRVRHPVREGVALDQTQSP